MAGTSRGHNILDDYANLAINDEEENGLILEEEPSDENADLDYSHCLVGRLLTNRKVNFLAMQDTLSSVWRPVKGVFMEATSFPNVFLFKFFHELDVRRVLEDGPWTFNQQTLIVKKLEADEQLANVKLFEISMWVQVYDLPLGFNSEFILKSIGNYVGKFMKSDPKNTRGMWRSYLRILVSVDVRCPLKNQMRIKKSGGDWIWIKFKYERLPPFCFYCGRIGHSEKFCEVLFDNLEDKGVRKYDSSLRAQVQRQAVNSNNQWLRSPDGCLLNPMEGWGGQTSSQVDGTMRESRKVVTVDSAVSDHISTKSGMQVVIVSQDKESIGANNGIGIIEGETYVNNTAGNNLKLGPAREIPSAKVPNGLGITDPKRRRVDEPILSGLPTEQINNNNNEDTDMILSQSAEDTEPKNLIMAGSALQTRQSS